MAAFRLIPRNRLIKPRRLVGFLISDCGRSGMSTRTLYNDLTVNDVDIPSHFVILRVITRIANKDAAIKWLLLVKGIDRLDGCVKNMSCIQHGICYSRSSSSKLTPLC